LTILKKELLKRVRASNAATRDRYPARSKNMGRREYAGGYPRRRYGGQSSHSSKSIFHYGRIPTRKRGRVMTKAIDAANNYIDFEEAIGLEELYARTLNLIIEIATEEEGEYDDQEAVVYIERLIGYAARYAKEEEGK
jgi:hypothetical protein